MTYKSTACPYPGIIRYNRHQLKGARAAPSRADDRPMSEFAAGDWHMVAYKVGVRLAMEGHKLEALRRDPSYFDKNPFRRADPEYLEFHASMIRGFETQAAGMRAREETLKKYGPQVPTSDTIRRFR